MNKEQAKQTYYIISNKVGLFIVTEPLRDEDVLFQTDEYIVAFVKLNELKTVRN